MVSSNSFFPYNGITHYLSAIVWCIVGYFLCFLNNINPAAKGNRGCHIEGVFQTQVLKKAHFKVPFRMKGIERHNWWILHSHNSLHRFNCVIMAPPLIGSSRCCRSVSQETALWSPIHPSTEGFRAWDEKGMQHSFTWNKRKSFIGILKHIHMQYVIGILP